MPFQPTDSTCVDLVRFTITELSQRVIPAISSLMMLKAIVCDVNETLFSLEAFRPRLREVGLGHSNALEVSWSYTVPLSYKSTPL